MIFVKKKKKKREHAKARISFKQAFASKLGTKYHMVLKLF